MKLFDLHCDTAYEMRKRRMHLDKNDLMVSLSGASKIEKYRQIMAIWSDCKKNDEECFKEYNLILGNLNHELELNGICDFPISVEDARILHGNIERVEKLYSDGVAVITPVWGGESCIGGAFDAEAGLTDFGKEAMNTASKLGIILDISHSSLKTASEIADISERHGNPVIATHSCAYGIYSHPRNLRTDQFERIKESGGIVGISFCRYHLTDSPNCGTEDVLRHIDYYLSLGGERILCIGADMDGAPMPDGIDGIASMPNIYNLIEKEFGKEIADRITWKNANGFSEKYFSKRIIK